MNAKGFGEFADLLKKEYKFSGSLRGLELFNANGDVAATDLGYQIAIDTLTYVKKEVIQQKFYEVNIPDYIHVAIGEGAFSQNLLQRISFNTSGHFADGNINQGSHNGKLSMADVGVSSINVPVQNWAKGLEYSIIEIQQALADGSLDVLMEKEIARKKNFELGIQEVAFLGLMGMATDFPGLFTNANVTSNTAVITKSISSMSSSEYATFVAALVAAFRANCVYTAWPTDFLIPEDDFLGLGTPVSSTYPNVTKLEYLEKVFASVVPKGVKIRPMVYGMTAYNSSFISGSKTRYVMYSKDPRTLRLELPVNYTATQAGTLNNFTFQNAAYAQYTGTAIFRLKEVLYFDY
jgi:hypothetical protein